MDSVEKYAKKRGEECKERIMGMPNLERERERDGKRERKKERKRKRQREREKDTNKHTRAFFSTRSDVQSVGNHHSVGA